MQLGLEPRELLLVTPHLLLQILRELERELHADLFPNEVVDLLQDAGFDWERAPLSIR